MKSNNETPNNDNWAAIGIGAMIVFISLILVAAVASAVIVQTAEKLQQNAQRTGDDTSDELSGKLTIQAGYVQNTGEYVLYVRLGAGSESIPVVDVSYQLYCAENAGYESGDSLPLMFNYNQQPALVAVLQQWKSKTHTRL